MKKTLAAAFVLASVLTAASARADVGQWSAELRPGYSALVGSSFTKDLLKDSFNVTAAADYQLDEMASAGLELGYDVGHKFEGTIFGQSFTSDINVPVYWLTPFVRFQTKMTTAGHAWTPYVTVGLGWYHSAKESGTATSGGASGPATVDGEDYWGLSVGPGFLVPINDRLSAGAELRFHDAFRNQRPPAELLTPSVNLSYRF